VREVAAKITQHHAQIELCPWRHMVNVRGRTSSGRARTLC